MNKNDIEVACNGIPVYVYVPTLFWDDHTDRCPSDEGDSGLCSVVRVSGKRTLVCGSAAQVWCLYSDAEFYAAPDGPDEAPKNLVASAKRTVSAIKEKIEHCCNQWGR